MPSLISDLLTIEYRKIGDRLEHSIGVRTQEEIHWFMHSIEGDSAEAWPASPPMQQIVEETLVPGAEPVLLGVGLSGTGHWSLAVESHPEGLTLDVACKNSKAATRLGSRYRLEAGWMARIDREGVLVSQANYSQSIRISCKIGSVAVEDDGQSVAIGPKSAPETAMTHRWCYRITCPSSQH